jgi:hypothetical protein
MRCVRSFWVREAKNSQAEVDFLYSDFEHGVVPVEVKSGHNSKLKSLHLFMESSSATVAIRFWAKPVGIDHIVLPSGKEFRLLNLPYYYAGFVRGCLRGDIASGRIPKPCRAIKKTNSL